MYCGVFEKLTCAYYCISKLHSKPCYITTLYKTLCLDALYQGIKSGIHPENLVSHICKTSFRSRLIDHLFQNVVFLPLVHQLIFAVSHFCLLSSFLFTLPSYLYIHWLGNHNSYCQLQRPHIMYLNILQTYVEVCEDKLFPFTTWREMFVLIARYRLAGLKIIICIKINRLLILNFEARLLCMLATVFCREISVVDRIFFSNPRNTELVISSIHANLKSGIAGILWIWSPDFTNNFTLPNAKQFYTWGSLYFSLALPVMTCYLCMACFTLYLQHFIRTGN
jgi:hypothetical protein